MKWMLIVLFGALALPTFASSVDDAVNRAGKSSAQNEIVAWSQNASPSIVTPSDVRRMRGAGVPDQAIRTCSPNKSPIARAPIQSRSVPVQRAGVLRILLLPSIL